MAHELSPKKAAELGIKDLGPTEGTMHIHGVNVLFHYGIQPDNTIVKYCPECGETWRCQLDDWCPHCRQKLNSEDPTLDNHLQGGGSDWSIVCPKPQ